MSLSLSLSLLLVPGRSLFQALNPAEKHNDTICNKRDVSYECRMYLS